MQPEVNNIGVILDPLEVLAAREVQNVVWGSWARIDNNPLMLKGQIGFPEPQTIKQFVLDEDGALLLKEFVDVVVEMRSEDYRADSTIHEKLCTNGCLNLPETASVILRLEESMEDDSMYIQHVKKFGKEIVRQLNLSRQINDFATIRRQA